MPDCDIDIAIFESSTPQFENAKFYAKLKKSLKFGTKNTLFVHFQGAI